MLGSDSSLGDVLLEFLLQLQFPFVWAECDDAVFPRHWLFLDVCSSMNGTAAVLWLLGGYPSHTVASKRVAKSMSKPLLGKPTFVDPIVALGELIMCAVYNYTCLVVCHS